MDFNESLVDRRIWALRSLREDLIGVASAPPDTGDPAPMPGLAGLDHETAALAERLEAVAVGLGRLGRELGETDHAVHSRLTRDRS